MPNDLSSIPKRRWSEKGDKAAILCPDRFWVWNLSRRKFTSKKKDATKKTLGVLKWLATSQERSSTPLKKDSKKSVTSKMNLSPGKPVLLESSMVG